MTRQRLLPLLLLAALAAPACKREAPLPAGQRYPIKGTVVEVDVAGRKVTIAHEDIPGFMPAMTMPFVVLEKDAALLQRVGPGDEVTATLVAPDSRYWLEDLVVVKKGTPDPNATPGPRAHEPHPGDAMPEVALVDQDGRSLRLADYRGKAVALTFIFTRCPLPDFCPLMMKKFASAHAMLEAEPDLAARTRLLTLSFDTAHDTPGCAARLREAVPEDDAALHALVARHREGRGDPGAGWRARARLRGGGSLVHPQPPHRGPRPRGEAPPAVPRQRLDAGGARRRAEGGRRGLSAGQSARCSRVRLRGPPAVTTTLSSTLTPPRGVRASIASQSKAEASGPERKGRSSIGMK